MKNFETCEKHAYVVLKVVNRMSWFFYHLLTFWCQTETNATNHDRNNFTSLSSEYKTLLKTENWKLYFIYQVMCDFVQVKKHDHFQTDYCWVFKTVGVCVCACESVCDSKHSSACVRRALLLGGCKYMGEIHQTCHQFPKPPKLHHTHITCVFLEEAGETVLST